MFPLAQNRVSGPGWSECARAGAAVKPCRGDALLFYRCALLEDTWTLHDPPCINSRAPPAAPFRGLRCKQQPFQRSFEHHESGWFLH